MDIAEQDCIRFTPPEVIGLPAVTEVAILPTRIELCSAGEWRAFPFGVFAKRRDSLLLHFLKRAFHRRVPSHIVGEREFCADRRYVRFFTDPLLTIYTPPDQDRTYGNTFIARINIILMKGGYATDDLS